MKLELFWPIKPSVIAQGFGENQLPLYREMGLAGHNGLDIRLPSGIGTPIYACQDGEITYAGVDGKEGYGVVIRTNEQFEDINGSPSYWKSIYWHLLKDIPVKAGQSVSVGDIIGYGDTTGYASGPHLHFGLKPIAQGENEWSWYNLNQNNGYFGAVDPTPYFNNFYSQDARLIISIYQKIVDLLKTMVVIWPRKG